MIKSIRFLTFSICVILIFASCQSNKFDTQILLGSWEVFEWKIEESGKSINNKMDMVFETEKNYSIDYGIQNEKGKYWITGEFLHTVETDQAEKKVKILQLNADTMKIQMNRGGHLESLVLVKKKKQ
ncbi:MAG: hypothetical protein ACI86M_003168 [Saprospiraceae bacterium]|jgi:hypothetical protein